MTTLDPDEHDKITAEGMMRFLEDLGLNPESRVVLVLAWKFKAATQCEFTKDEFINGMMDLGFVPFVYSMQETFLWGKVH